MGAIDDIRPPRQVASANGGDMALFESIRRQACAELPGLLAGYFEAVRGQAHEAWMARPNARQQQHDREASIGLALRAELFADAWRARIGTALDAWLQADAAAPPHDAQGLSLVSEAQLQMQLLVQELGDELEETLASAIEPLDARLRQLAAALGGGQRGASPLRPGAVGLVFVEGFAGEDLGTGLATSLVQEFGRRLPAALESLYPSIERQLAQAGHAPHAAVAPAIRDPGTAARATAKPPGEGWLPDGGVVDAVPAGTRAQVAAATMAAVQDAPSQARAFAPPPAAPQEGVPMRYRDIVHDHLRHWRAAASQPAANDAASDEAVLGTQALYTVASLLQGDDPAPFARLLTRDGGRPLSGAIREAVSSGARQLGLAVGVLRFAPDQEDAIDLVAMLFEALMHTRPALAPEGAIPRLYGHLVMPYLKIALLDDSLFNRRNHPARQLIDALTEICEDEPHDPDGVALAESVVERIVAGYREDLAVFELAVDELRQFQRQQRRRAELAERRAAEALHGRERLQEARRQARVPLEAWASRQPCTEALAEFLHGPWRLAYERACLLEDADPERPRALHALGEGLLALDAAAREPGGDIARRWLALAADVEACCRGTGMEGAGFDLLVARMVFAFAHPDMPRRMHPLPADADADGGDAEARAALSLAGGLDTVAHDPALAARMRRLRPGQALRLIDAHGRESHARVAWVSPLTSRLLVVNRRGQRQLVASPEQLAALVAAGHLAVCAADAPFDQAMKRLWQQLNQASVNPAHGEPMAAVG